MVSRGPTSWPRRPVEGRVVGGVARGLAEHWQVPVSGLRLALVLLAFAWGLGVLLYLLAWAAMPLRSASVRRLRDVPRANWRGLGGEVRATARRHRGRLQQAQGLSPRVRRVAALVLLTAGVTTLLASFGALDWITPTRAFGLALLGLGLATLIAGQSIDAESSLS